MKKMPTIKTITRINMSDLRSLCIRKNWYTCGTYEQYDNFLNKVYDNDNITTCDIYDLSIDVIEHSNLKEYAKSCGMSTTSTDFIECIMYEIGALIETFYDIEK